MYRHYFGTSLEPFGVSPDPKFFFPSPMHAEASASLYYSIAERRGFALLVGHPGLGKTSVLVNLATRLSGEAKVAFLVHPSLDGDSVLDSLLFAMGLDPHPDPVRRLQQFYSFLLDLAKQGKTAVAIIDEAQNLSYRALEAIRMLSNFETPTKKLIQFILAGQPGIEGMLAAPECEQIVQRISSVVRLNPLSRLEVGKYIGHRLSVAGVEKSPFSAQALDAIFELSGGVPRNINKICFNALTLAFADGKKLVDSTLIRQANSEAELIGTRLSSSSSGQTVSVPEPNKFSNVPTFKLSRRLTPVSVPALLTMALTAAALIGAGLAAGIR